MNDTGTGTDRDTDTEVRASRRPRRWRTALAAVAVVGAAVAAAAPALAGEVHANAAVVAGGRVVDLGPSRAPGGTPCRSYEFTVAMTEGSPAEHQIYGELCARGRVTSRTPLQILLHGGTYDHAYWDWPFQPRRYSYVEQATRQGFATLNLDRLGYGRSDHPDPNRLDSPSTGTSPTRSCGSWTPDSGRSSSTDTPWVGSRPNTRLPAAGSTP